MKQSYVITNYSVSPTDNTITVAFRCQEADDTGDVVWSSNETLNFSPGSPVDAIHTTLQAHLRLRLTQRDTEAQMALEIGQEFELPTEPTSPSS